MSVEKNSTIGVLPATVDNNATRATPSNDQAEVALAIGGKNIFKLWLLPFFGNFPREATFRKVLRLFGHCPNSF